MWRVLSHIVNSLCTLLWSVLKAIAYSKRTGPITLSLLPEMVQLPVISFTCSMGIDVRDKVKYRLYVYQLSVITSSTVQMLIDIAK